MTTSTSTTSPGPVVVGYDGSEHGEYALRWAADEAQREHRTLTIVNVISSLMAYELSALTQTWVMPSEVRAAILTHAREELEEVRTRLLQNLPELTVELVVREGDPRDVLLDLSESAAAVFIGSRGRGAVKSLLLGSVGVAVSRAARCPVFVIRPVSAGHDRRGVLVGTDCSERTRPTLEFAFRQASLRGLPLTVLHCYGGIETVNGLATIIDDDLEGYDDSRLELAESVAGLAEQFPDVRVRLRIGHGNVDVCLVGESQHMDLVVVGHHERSVADLIHLGSFVVPVVESAWCPVAVVNDPPKGAR